MEARVALATTTQHKDRMSQPNSLHLAQYNFVFCPVVEWVNYDRITTQAQHQRLPLGYQMHHHTVSVLQPEVTRARSAQDEAIEALTIRPAKSRKCCSPVDIALCLDL
jgi:hypothetical protein